MIKKVLSVLLIEDNPADANLVIELLEQSNLINFEVIWSTKLRDGLNKLKSQTFDAILLDLSLPDSWGIETLIETLKKTQNIPIIVLTGEDNDELGIKFVKKGAQDFLVKGQVNNIGLIHSIQYAIERKKMEDSLKETHQKLIESETKLLILRDKLEQKVIERSYGLGERIKELSCLYNISKIVEDPNMILEDIFQNVIDRIPIAMKYPEITCSRIFFSGQEFKTKNFKETKWKLTAKIIIGSMAVGSIEIIYLNKKPLSYEGPFTKEERDLIDAVSEILGRFTERKQAMDALRESEEEFRTLVKTSPYSIILLDSNKIIYDCNSVAELYLNKPKEELIDKNFFEIFPTITNKIYSIDEFIHNIFYYNLSEIIEFEYIPDGSNKVWVQAFFSLVEIWKKKFIRIILQDITERKLAENIITEENERLRKLDQFKTQLTTQTSEELKSPLNNMFNASQTLLSSYSDKLDENAINLLELIKNGGEKSINLVERIIDISKLESDKFKLNKQTESLIEVINESVNEIKKNVKKSMINFNLDLSRDLYSEVDKPRIIQVIKDMVLLNIMQNTPKRSEISISLRERKNYVEISIKNSGKILTEKENKRIFSSKNYDGLKESLLGMRISKEIVKLHGGQIILESEKNNKDFNYIIRLPIKNLHELLIELYIIYKSGILLHYHQYVKERKKLEADLISGSFIGIMTILKEVSQGEKHIKTIDHGDRKLMFEFNVTKDIIFVLIVREDLTVFRNKLNVFIEEFDKVYKNLMKNIGKAACIVDNWTGIDTLTIKYFGN